MNSETENSSGYKLQGAFGDKGTQVNSIGYGHPHAEDIIKEAKEIIAESSTGKLLIKVHNVHNIPIQVIKGTGDSGFNTDSRIIYLQAPGKTKRAEPKLVLQLIKALREADQDIMGVKAPNPEEDLMAYATVIHGKNLDSIIHICKVVKELTNSSSFSILLEGIADLGYSKFYKAYINDATKDELFDVYAET
ncbi:MAG: hypothetical protein AAGB32_01090 [Pseudomonadota bacterium]